MRQIFLIINCCLLCTFLLIGCSMSNHQSNNSNSDQQYNIYFVKALPSDYKLTPVVRTNNYLSEDLELKSINTLINYLLAGPTGEEKKNNLFTEIPKNTKCLDIKEGDKFYEINLSQDFLLGGGSLSMQVRLDQFTKTIQAFNPDKFVLLLIEGKRINHIGGEGYIFNNPVYTGKDQDKNKPYTDKSNNEELEAV